MNPDEIRDLIAAGAIATPYEIHTRGGETYTVESAGNARISQTYPDTVIIVRRGLTIALLGLDEIEAITPFLSGPESDPGREGGSK